MEIFYGYVFQNFINHKELLTEELLDRAIKKNILTPCGAEYLRNLQ